MHTTYRHGSIITCYVQKHEKLVQSKFAKLWIQEINRVKVGSDYSDHNKLRGYKMYKGFFGLEPYISKVNNRKQSCHLSRLRTSSHNLKLESGRWSGVPVSQRLCIYCNQSQVDDEEHCLLSCPTFSTKRNCFFAKLGSMGVSFNENCPKEDILARILCPKDAKMAKLVNKYIGILFHARDQLDQGFPINFLLNRTETLCEIPELSDASDESSYCSEISFLDSSEDSFEL